jgi:hypothetical protein
METGDDDNAFEDIFNRQLDQIDSTELTDQQIHALHIICGSDILLAALELLDHKAGIYFSFFCVCSSAVKDMMISCSLVFDLIG